MTVRYCCFHGNNYAYIVGKKEREHEMKHLIAAVLLFVYSTASFGEPPADAGNVLEGTLYPENAQEVAYIMAYNGISYGDIKIIEIAETLIYTCRFPRDRFSRENDDAVAEATAYILGVSLASMKYPEIEFSIAIYD